MATRVVDQVLEDFFEKRVNEDFKSPNINRYLDLPKREVGPQRLWLNTNFLPPGGVDPDILIIFVNSICCWIVEDMVSSRAMKCSSSR